MAILNGDANAFLFWAFRPQVAGRFGGGRHSSRRRRVRIRGVVAGERGSRPTSAAAVRGRTSPGYGTSGSEREGSPAVAGVSIVRPSDGALIGTIAPSDAIPDMLRVDERCDVYVAEDSGHLVAFGALPRLSLVPR